MILGERLEGVDRLGRDLGEEFEGDVAVVGVEDRDLFTLFGSLLLIFRVGFVQIGRGYVVDVQQCLGGFDLASFATVSAVSALDSDLEVAEVVPEPTFWLQPAVTAAIINTVNTIAIIRFMFVSFLPTGSW